MADRRGRGARDRDRDRDRDYARRDDRRDDRGGGGRYRSRSGSPRRGGRRDADRDRRDDRYRDRAHDRDRGGAPRDRDRERGSYGRDRDRDNRDGDRRDRDRYTDRRHRDHRDETRPGYASRDIEDVPPTKEGTGDAADRREERSEYNSPLPTRVKSDTSTPVSFHMGKNDDDGSQAAKNRPDDVQERGRSHDRGDAMEEYGEDEDDVEVDEDAAAMQAMMGFGGFGSTKGTKVAGNKAGGVRKEKKSEYRQYMNRVGGFNRPLSPSR